MFTKLLVIAVFLTILGSLASGLYYMVKDRGQSDRTVKALTLRVGLSVCLFVLLFILYAVGLIQPHSITTPL